MIKLRHHDLAYAWDRVLGLLATHVPGVIYRPSEWGVSIAVPDRTYGTITLVISEDQETASPEIYRPDKET